MQLGKPYQLLNYIDNKDNEKTIGLKSTTYWVGWYNVTGKQHIATKNKRTDLEPGLYNFNDLEDIFFKSRHQFIRQQNQWISHTGNTHKH